MKSVHADLHIHSVLSPCGDLDMSPATIVRIAAERRLDVIGITDHNSTRQAGIIRDYAQKHGMMVLTGAEVTTCEEVHCLVFMKDDETLAVFQQYLDRHLPDIPNVPDKFGYQVVADERDQIVYEEPKLLISALDQSLDEVQREVRRLNGIFIPAHIDKSRFSLLSQLGFVPGGLQADALELSCHTLYGAFINKHPELKNYPFIQSSDAHYPADIGKVYTIIEVKEISFEGIREGIGKLQATEKNYKYL